MAFVSGIPAAKMSHHHPNKGVSQLSINKPVSACGCIDIKQAFSKIPKKKSNAKLTKERIRQFSIWFFEREEQREQENTRRRRERNKERKLEIAGAGSAGRWIWWLYGVDTILWIIGILFTICSTVKTIGKSTPFYQNRKLFNIVGPGVICVAIFVLFVAVGIKHRIRKKHKPKRPFYIVDKKGKEHLTSSSYTKDPDKDSGNEEDIEMYVTKPFYKPRSDGKTESVAKCWTNKYYHDSFDDKLSEETQGEDVSDLEDLESSVDPFMRAFKNRRQWAKTKWMRIKNDSDDSLELENPARYRDVDETRNLLEDTMMATPRPNGNDKHFRPLLRGCLQQSSTKSQASTSSSVSTTSESAPLVRTKK